MIQDLTDFVREYERAANSHDFSQVQPLIDDSAVFIFTDGTYRGMDEIRDAFVRTFNKIQEEEYRISDVSWVTVEDNFAVYDYNFSWKGIVDGELKSGEGKGSNVVVKKDSKWKIIFEHLSKNS